MYARLEAGVAKMTASQKQDLVSFAKSIATKYPDTPTGKKAAALASDLGG